MEFSLSDEQKMMIDMVRSFVDKEMVPHEEEVERLGLVPEDLAERIKAKSLEAGIYAANMPEEMGGGGLDNLSIALIERQLGRTSYGLQYIVARPSNILRACTGDQIERYLLPTIRGERVECLAMSEPDAGSDLRGMRCRAERDGDEYVITGTKHFISHADVADYVILFAASDEQEDGRKLITSFLIDMGTPGFEVKKGYRSVSHRGYNNSVLEFDGCRVSVSSILGVEHRGFDVANEWLGPRGSRWRPLRWAEPIGRSRSPRSGLPTDASSAGRSASSRASRSNWPTWPRAWRRPNCSPIAPPGMPTRGP